MQDKISMKNLFFFGTPEIATPSLKKLAQLTNINIIGVGTFPDRKTGRKQILSPCPVKTTARELNLPIYEIKNKRDLIHVFEKEKIDMGLVIAFGMIFPKSILNIPEYGVVNVHYSLLPKYRGASPVQSAILNGDKTSGITFQKMVRKIDAGDVLFQKEFNIENQKTSEVFSHFAQESAEMLPKFLELYYSDSIYPQKQDNNQATFCGLFERKDGEVFPDKETAEEIYQKYLAFDIFPGIYVNTYKGNIKLTDVSLSPSENAHPLACANNTDLQILRAQLPGKQEMQIQDILRGTPNIFIRM